MIKDNDITINVLTRTSNRPKAFENCRKSVSEQNYSIINHFVTYENLNDLNYFQEDIIKKILVEGKEILEKHNLNGYKHAPYNLHCNVMLNEIKNGWIIFLDDDDNFIHNNVVQELVNEIKKNNEDTLFIWQMRYPNGKILPKKEHFKNSNIEINNIGSPCFMFHSKYKEFAKWDEYKASDYRVVKRLSENIPHQKWLKRVYIQINNYGDFGLKNDLNHVSTISNLVFKMSWCWSFIPKYHFKLFDVYVFHYETYKKLWRRFKNLLEYNLNRDN